MYTNQVLIKQIQEFNKNAKIIGDYEIDVKKIDNKKVPYQLFMKTENGEKHKFAGTCKECIMFLLQ